MVSSIIKYRQRNAFKEQKQLKLEFIKIHRQLLLERFSNKDYQGL